jgi:hypothetical protein
MLPRDSASSDSSEMNRVWRDRKHISCMSAIHVGFKSYPSSALSLGFLTKACLGLSLGHKALRRDSHYPHPHPCPIADLAASVWVVSEGGGSALHVMLAKSDAWDLYGRLLKVGELVLALDPDPFGGKDLNMTLDPTSAAVTVSGAGGWTVAVYVDANQPVVRIRVSGTASVNTPVGVSVENRVWRTERRPLGGDADFGPCRTEYSTPDDVCPQPVLKQVRSGGEWWWW